jgi:hypothetical protein
LGPLLKVYSKAHWGYFLKEESMAKRIVLISCVKKKVGHRAKARDLYVSPWFRLAFRYAQQLRPDQIFILSAKYGLLGPDAVVDPYEKTLNKMPATEVKAWAEQVIGKLRRHANLASDHFIILASERYRRHLRPHLGSSKVPMEGLDRCKQLHWLKERVEQ